MRHCFVWGRLPLIKPVRTVVSPLCIGRPRPTAKSLMNSRPTGSAAACFVGFLALLAGCSDRPPITSYTVNKPVPLKPLPNPHDAGLPMTLPSQAGAEASADAPPSGEPTDRTLAAILPITPQGWFFKLTGPIAAVAA